MRKPMDDPNNTTGTLEADEDILNYTVSDEAIEAASGIERWEGLNTTPAGFSMYPDFPKACCL
jgi:hypothetical protein